MNVDAREGVGGKWTCGDLGEDWNGDEGELMAGEDVNGSARSRGESAIDAERLRIDFLELTGLREARWEARRMEVVDIIVIFYS